MVNRFENMFKAAVGSHPLEFGLAVDRRAKDLEILFEVKALSRPIP